MTRNKKKRIDTGPSSGALGSLGDVLAEAGFTASVSETEPPDEPVPHSSQDGPDLTGKLTVRKERKGRKGKTVTVIQGIVGDDESLSRLMKKMRKDLGCGAHLEECRIILQGDLVQRARSWLDDNRAC